MDLASWLHTLTEPRDLPGSAELADLRDDIDAQLAPLAGRASADDPLRMSKSRLADLAMCERAALARDRDAGTELGPALLRGVALDLFVTHELARGRVREPLADLCSMLRASGRWEELELVEQLDDVEAGDAELVEQLEGMASAAGSSWSGVDPAWVPRTQTHATALFAGARIVVSGRADVELGGLDTGRPGVVIEVKSGRPSASHQAEVYLYGLLCALRDRRAPSFVARWYPGGAPSATPVSLGLLESAARRLVDGIRRWAELADGDVPTESAGPQCGWCPDRLSCPSAVETEASSW